MGRPVLQTENALPRYSLFCQLLLRGSQRLKRQNVHQKKNRKIFFQQETVQTL